MRRSIIISFSAISLAFASVIPRQNQITQINNVCTVTSQHDAGSDDVPAISQALQTCGNGGTIILPSGSTYALLSVLNLNGCRNCDFQIEGTLKASNNLTYWAGKQAMILVSGINTARIRSVTGSGVIDGNGQASYDYFAKDKTLKRPTLLYITGSSGISVTNLRIKNPQNVFASAAGNSVNVLFQNLNLSAASKSSAVPKNTDGIDVGPAQYVTVDNIKVENQDDCVALKPGASFTTITNVECIGSHGISVGSLGSRAGSTDTVSNAYIHNIHMTNSTKAVGLKLYEGGPSHGSPVISNVTYDTVVVKNCGYAFQVQSCYASTSAADCQANPSTAKISNVFFKNFSGSVAAASGSVVGNLNCPSAGTCGLRFDRMLVSPQKGGLSNVLCGNINESDNALGITCSPGASG